MYFQRVQSLLASEQPDNRSSADSDSEKAINVGQRVSQSFPGARLSGMTVDTEDLNLFAVDLEHRP